MSGPAIEHACLLIGDLILLKKSDVLSKIKNKHYMRFIMDDFDDMTLSDITEVLGEDFYASKEPKDFDVQAETSDDEDTLTRMILDSQKIK